ncbi:NADP-dependent oxidoreductase domain-containing protein [Flagelloscypha sp. PMI_526]|nr:NADP-dependent oxidoreductase domain-containing protein [Flagelloscypha sp. PMI_526]
MSLGKKITLNNGTEIPQIGLGTWLSAPGEVKKAVEHALKVGYRHIDAALIYKNQPEVAEGIAASGVPRKDIFLTSKLWNNHHRLEMITPDLDLTLKQLGTDYLDLYLIHWPVPFEPTDDFEELIPSRDGSGSPDIDANAPGIVPIWLEMVKLLKTGKVKAVGVSNFTVKHLKMLAEASDVVPAVNQVEAHPLLQQPDLEEYCKEKGIHITAYSPLGNNLAGRTKLVDTEKVVAIAKKAGKDPAQVLIGWGVSRGFSVVPKSVTPSRIESNFQQYVPTPEEVKEIDGLLASEGKTRYNRPATYDPPWAIDIFDEPEEQGNRKAW